jgi:hypothetical protein
MKFVGSIYRITIDRGGSSPCYYVGQSSKGIGRWNQHLNALRRGRHDNIRMLRAFRKYGEQAFNFEIILFCDLNKDIMNFYEQIILNFYIQEFGDRRVVNVMRQCVNTHLGVKRRPETIMAMSLSQKGRPKPPDQVAKMALALTGKKRSLESREAQSKRMKGQPLHPNFIGSGLKSPLRVENIRLALAGKPKIHSQETIEKISKSLTGRVQNKNSNEKRSLTLKGRKHSPEHIANRVASRKRKAEERIGNC